METMRMRRRFWRWSLMMRSWVSEVLAVVVSQGIKCAVPLHLSILFSSLLPIAHIPISLCFCTPFSLSVCVLYGSVRFILGRVCV